MGQPSRRSAPATRLGALVALALAGVLAAAPAATAEPASSTLAGSAPVAPGAAQSSDITVQQLVQRFLADRTSTPAAGVTARATAKANKPARAGTAAAREAAAADLVQQTALLALDAGSGPVAVNWTRSFLYARVLARGTTRPEAAHPRRPRPANPAAPAAPAPAAPASGCPDLFKALPPSDPCAAQQQPPHKPDTGDDGNMACFDEARTNCVPVQPDQPCNGRFIACQPVIPTGVWQQGGGDAQPSSIAGDLSGLGDGTAAKDAGIGNLNAVRDAIRVADASAFTLGAGL